MPEINDSDDENKTKVSSEDSKQLYKKLIEEVRGSPLKGLTNDEEE